MKFVLISLFMLIICNGVFAQSPYFINYTADNGLPGNEVYHVFQDSKGFIWFATNNGVSRFDGSSYMNFDMENGLPDNTVFEIYEDKKGKIWFITFSSKLSYFFKNKIYLYKFNDRLTNISNNSPNPLKNCFFVDEDDNIVFESFNCGTVRISKTGNLTVDGTSSTENTIWENEGKLIPKTRLVVPEIHFKLKNDTFSLMHNIPTMKTVGYTFLEKLWGKYLLTKGNTLFIMEKGKPIDYKFFDSRIVWTGNESNELFWIGLAKKGVLGFDSSDFNNYKYHFLKDYTVTSVLKDNCGGHWFSTLEQGVFYAPSLNIIFYQVESGLKNKQVNSVLPLGDEVILGLQGNNIAVLSDKGIKHLDLDGRYDINVNKLGLWGDVISVCSDKYPVTTHGKGRKEIAIMDSKKFMYVFGTGSAVLNKDTMFITSTTGLFIATADSIKKIISNEYYSRSDVITNNDGENFFIGAINGLFEFNYRKNILKNLSEKSEEMSFRIIDIVKNDQVYYFATRGNGLVVYKNGVIAKITRKNGLSSNVINSLTYFEGCVWAATNKGLNILKFKESDFQNPEIMIINKNHGLPSDVINQVKIDKSVVYLATSEGLAVFNKEFVLHAQKHSVIYAKSIEINGKEREIKKSYVLNSDENSIYISFNYLNYRISEKKYYRYKLEGVDDKWNTGTENTARYSSLKPGNYRFVVYAQNEDMEWSPNPLIIEFEILASFWQTLWFSIVIWLLAVVLIAVIFYRIYQIRMRNFNKTFTLQQELNLYRQKALTQQMNPHFLFNSLNSIQYFIYKNDKEKSAEYLSKFSLLLRLILENSQQQQITIRREIQAIDLYLELESLRFRGDFKYEIVMDPMVDADMLLIPALIIQPFVENAIWHGLLHKLEGNKRLVVELKKDGEMIECIIEDNGIGRDKSREINERQKNHESLGIRITKNRLQLINSLYGKQLNLKYIDLKDEAGNPLGTKVVLNLPVIK